MMEDVRIAVVTCRCPAGEVDYNLDNTAHWTARAKMTGAKVVCLPELNISGYCLDWKRCQAAADCYDQVVRDLGALAAQEQITVLAGTVRPCGNEGQFVACHLAVYPDRRVGVYEKLHIAPPEAPLFTPGDDIPLFSHGSNTFGIQLCYDAHFPELATRMAVDGADIVFMPHASPHKSTQEKYTSWMRHLPARAYDNTVFVVVCNQSGDNGVDLEFPGLALVLGPSGDVLARRLQPEGMLVADLSAGHLAEIRNHRMRYFLPHRRGDLYRL